MLPSDVDNDVDTAYCSIDTESKTLLASPCQNKEIEPESSFAANINNVLCGRAQDSGIGESRNSQSPDSQISVSKEQLSGSHNPSSGKVSITNFDFQQRRKNASTIPRDRKWVNEKSLKSNSQPFNRIDLAPTSNQPRTGQIQNSPMLAPRARKEVAPDSGLRYVRTISSPIQNANRLCLRKLLKKTRLICKTKTYAVLSCFFIAFTMIGYSR